MPAIGFPPKNVTLLLRLEGAVVFASVLVAYAALGGNWWIFALLVLAPDLAMLAYLKDAVLGARLYNAVHTYAVPLAIGLVAYLVGATALLPFVLIWLAHIGIDRAVGYGLKYPGLDHHTHLGLIGPAKRSAKLADAR